MALVKAHIETAAGARARGGSAPKAKKPAGFLVENLPLSDKQASGVKKELMAAIKETMKKNGLVWRNNYWNEAALSGGDDLEMIIHNFMANPAK